MDVVHVGGEGTFADDGDVRASLALCQEGRPGLPEPLALVSMTCTEGIGLLIPYIIYIVVQLEPALQGRLNPHTRLGCAH